MAEKVIQHFISQFMLRRWRNPGGRILIFNGTDRKYITIGESKKYFADKYLYENNPTSPDALLEDRLSDIERSFSMLSAKIINSVEQQGNYNLNEKEIALVETFCYLQEMRNKDYLSFFGSKKSDVLKTMNLFIDSYEKYIKMGVQEKRKLYIEAKSQYDRLWQINKKFPYADVYNSLDFERAKLYENPEYFLAVHSSNDYRFVPREFNNNLPLAELGSIAVGQRTGPGEDDTAEFTCIPLSPNVGILKYANFNERNEQLLISREFNGSEKKQDDNLLIDSFTGLFIKTQWVILPPKFSNRNLKREFKKYKPKADIAIKGPNYSDGKIKKVNITRGKENLKK